MIYLINVFILIVLFIRIQIIDIYIVYSDFHVLMFHSNLICTNGKS